MRLASPRRQQRIPLRQPNPNAHLDEPLQLHLDGMAEHTALLGHHDTRHPGEHVLEHAFAKAGILHLGAAYSWLLRFLDSYGLCESQVDRLVNDEIFADAWRV